MQALERQPARPVTRTAAPHATSGAISAVPQTVDLALYAGDDFMLAVTVTNPDNSPADLTGETATAQVRATAGAADPAAGAFVCSIAANVVTLTLAHAVTATLPSSAVWDCQLTSSTGDVRTIVHGAVTMTADVTRP